MWLFFILFGLMVHKLLNSIMPVAPFDVPGLLHLKHLECGEIANFNVSCSRLKLQHWTMRFDWSKKSVLLSSDGLIGQKKSTCVISRFTQQLVGRWYLSHMYTRSLIRCHELLALLIFKRVVIKFHE